MRYLYGPDRYIPRRLEGLEKWGRLTSPSLAKENITAAEEEKDSGFGEACMERGSDEVFMQITPSRDAATLLPVIIANVKPGTEIHTDEWRSYSRLNRRGYAYTTRLIIP